MTVRGLKAGTNEVVLIPDEEAAPRFLSGEVGFFPDQLVPIRHDDGTIHRYHSSDVAGALAASPGRTLDFVEGNRSRARLLKSQQYAREVEDLPIPGALTALATATTNQALLGLPGDYLRQQAIDASKAPYANVPNPGRVAYYRQQGHTEDDALLLAQASYEGEDPTGSLEAAYPIASGIGQALGFVAPAIITGGAAAAVEAPMAAVGAARLASAGLPSAVSTFLANTAASGAVAGTEMVAQGVLQRAGQELIRHETPKFHAEQIIEEGIGGFLFGAVGAGLVHGAGAAVRAVGRRVGRVGEGAVASAAAREAQAATQRASLMSASDSVGSMTDDILAPLGDETALSKLTRARIRLAQELGAPRDVAVKMTHPEYQDLMAMTDDVYNGHISTGVNELNNIDRALTNAEVDYSQGMRRAYSEGAARHLASAEVPDMVASAERIQRFGEDLASGNILGSSGRQAVAGAEHNPIVASVVRAGRGISELTPTLRAIDDTYAAFVEAESAFARAESRVAALEQGHEQLMAQRRSLEDSLNRGLIDPYAHKTASDALEQQIEAYSRERFPAVQAALSDEASAQAILDSTGKAHSAAIANLPVQLQDASEKLVNIQAQLARDHASLTFHADQGLSDMVQAALDKVDSLVSDPSLFGRAAAESTTNLPVFRSAQRARRTALQSLGKNVSEGAQNIREFDHRALRALADSPIAKDVAVSRGNLGEFLNLARAATEQASPYTADGALVASSVDRASRELVAHLQQNVFAPGSARRGLLDMKNSGKWGGAARGFLSSGTGLVTGSVLGGAPGGVLGFSIGSLLTAMSHPEHLAYIQRGLRTLSEGVAGKRASAIGRAVAHIGVGSSSLGVSARAVRSMGLRGALYATETRGPAIDQLVATVGQYTDNPQALATHMAQAGIDTNSPLGMEGVAGYTQAMAYLRSQMPESMFDPLIQTPPHQRISGAVTHNIIKTVEGIESPTSLMDDLTHGIVSQAKVQAVRAVYPQFVRDYTTAFMGAYSDRVARQEHVPYATRMNISRLIGTAVESSLRQPNLAMFQNRSAQTTAQAQAQGMGRQPARAVHSLTTSTLTEGSALQDNQ